MAQMTEAKQVSKIGMIVGAVIIVGYNAGYLLLARRIPTIDEQKSILMVGGSMLLMFSPIYLSIVLDKIVNIFKR